VLLHEAERAGVPVALASAPAERAQPGARPARRRPLLAPGAAQPVRACSRRPRPTRSACAQFGARDVRVCGNLKFDLQPARRPASHAAGTLARRRSAGAVVLAAVTREGEEAALLREPGRRSPRRARCS
jgi:3-deoxy-D-manno-octulosonic-acid transferase